ncbi:MAG TPA: cation diffusion facilitator family transporter [Dehalococcoidales bacterium]|nr:cation diffusion facilitator family transporter [Dehalococcoidales bacterium]
MHHEENHVPAAARPLTITLIMTAVIMAVEIIGGLMSHSLALLSDAGHMLTDIFALGLGLFAINIARRPATATRTYGFHRAEIMAALANGAILILVSAVIFYEAYQRFSAQPTIKSPLMIGVAVVGLVANIVSVMLLRRGSKGSINVRAAFWHVMGDTLSSIGVIIAGIIIYFTGWYIADPILAIVIGVVILWGAVGIVRESTDILLESVPAHVKVPDVSAAVKAVPGVVDMHDIHIWTITSGIYALSAHLAITDQMVSQSSDVITRVNDVLAKQYSITHTTLQLECESCPTGLVCNLPTAEKHEH